MCPHICLSCISGKRDGFVWTQIRRVFRSLFICSLFNIHLFNKLNIAPTVQVSDTTKLHSEQNDRSKKYPIL